VSFQKYLFVNASGLFYEYSYSFEQNVNWRRKLH